MADAVRDVARHCYNPSAAHWSAAYNILHNIKTTRTFGLVLENGYGVYLGVCSDSDYARNNYDGRYIMTIAVICGKSLVSWSSRTQKYETTPEAEYRAMAEPVMDTPLVRNISRFLVSGGEGNYITVVHEDNEGAISLWPMIIR